MPGEPDPWKDRYDRAVLFAATLPSQDRYEAINRAAVNTTRDLGYALPMSSVHDPVDSWSMTLGEAQYKSAREWSRKHEFFYVREIERLMAVRGAEIQERERYRDARERETA